MEQGAAARDFLQRKLHILEQMAAKNETLGRFVRDHKMTGLRRVLRERQTLIDELAAANAEWDDNPGWKNTPGLTPLLQAIAGKQQEVREHCRQVLQQARAEKARLATELKNTRIQRQIRNRYTNPWTVLLPGRCFNEKG